MKATFIKEGTSASGAFWKLYKLDKPLRGAFYVRVSAVNVMLTGPETFIFRADENGKITDWEEIEGSYKGGLDHEEALRNAGYEVEA